MINICYYDYEHDIFVGQCMEYRGGPAVPILSGRLETGNLCRIWKYTYRI